MVSVLVSLGIVAFVLIAKFPKPLYVFLLRAFATIIRQNKQIVAVYKSINSTKLTRRIHRISIVLAFVPLLILALCILNRNYEKPLPTLMIVLALSLYFLGVGVVRLILKIASTQRKHKKHKNQRGLASL